MFHDVNGVFSPYVGDLLIATLSFGESQIISQCQGEKNITCTFKNKKGIEDYLSGKKPLNNMVLTFSSMERDRVVKTSAFRSLLHGELKYKVLVKEN